MAAIMKGLESVFVKRLHQTWRDIPDKHITMMREMNKILEPADAYEKYYQALREGDGECVPLLGVSLCYQGCQNITSLLDFPDVHVREIDDALSRHPAVIPVRERELINFSRCVDIAACLDKLKELHAPKENCEHGKVIYVKRQLQRIPIGPLANAKFDILSKTLEEEEEIYKQSRIREWRIVGIKTPTAHRNTRSR
jgi:hypothetical protein